MNVQHQWPDDVTTLAVDIGGSGFKAALLNAAGEMTTDRVRVDTPYPVDPEKFVVTVAELVRPLGSAQRATVGFPGLVRDGKVVEVPSMSRREFGGARDENLAAAWNGFEIESELARAFGIPTIVANDADVQGSAVVSGNGFEFVMTLGTGVGTALFNHGILLPHMELSHAPMTKSMSFDIALGEANRKAVGNKKWRKLVATAIEHFYEALYFDRIYVGGGNARHLKSEDIDERVVIVPNSAGITGGVKVWAATAQ